ncbi:MAG: pyridoxal-dependent decarboxylase [Pseudomonadota bacterium]
MAKLTSNHAQLEAVMADIANDLNLDHSKPVDASAWFLGPKGENGEALKALVEIGVKRQILTRETYMSDDPRFTPEFDQSHEDSIQIIKDELNLLMDKLEGSIPLASYRNQSHMYWDLTLPGIAGYFASMLYNQNNVAAEASPVTTLLEVQVGKDFCQMLGFPHNSGEPKATDPWGHITCDGSVANGESMWAARNLKYLPVALAAAIATEPGLEDARCVAVQTCQGKWGRLIDLSVWELLNLPIDDVIGLVDSIVEQTGLDKAFIAHFVDTHAVQNIGLIDFQRRFLETHAQATPVVLAPATAHYSWPKTAALLGLGTQASIPVEVDLDGRMSIPALRRALCDCLEKGRPVLQVVAVLGSTEEGSVDPLAEIVALRREFQGMGLNFVIHVDGAWGGYFSSLLRIGSLGTDLAAEIDRFPALYVSEHFDKHFRAIAEVDSVTLDPHKSGFIPYPAGGLCYRNGGMRDLIAFTAPVVTHGGVDVTVGPYGIEGSKPGAAPTAVYLSNKVIPLNQDGYGRLLGRCLFNSKRFYSALVTMDLADDNKIGIHVTPFQRLPAEREGGKPADIQKQKQYIANNFIHCTTNALIQDVMGMGQPEKTEAQKKATELFQKIGSDLSIVTYALNFSTPAGLNQNLELMNELNDRVFRKLSLQPEKKNAKTKGVPSAEMFVTASAFDPAHYGSDLVDNFVTRAGATPEPDTAVNFLISTTQNPWLSTTVENQVMIGKLIDILRATAVREAEAIIKEHGLD